MELSYEAWRRIYLEWERRRNEAIEKIVEILDTVNPVDVKYVLDEAYRRWKRKWMES